MRPAQGQSIVVSDVALFASVFANLKQYGKTTELETTVAALQRMVEDWQEAYQGLNAQLEMVLRANEEQTRLISNLRAEVDRVRRRASDAEARALAAEAARNRTVLGG